MRIAGRLLLIIFLFCFGGKVAGGQIPKKAIDVISYVFDLTVNDSNDSLVGISTIQFKLLEDVKTVSFDLAGGRSNGKGMTVSQVTDGNSKLVFRHDNNQVKIEWTSSGKAGDVKLISIYYRGIPSDGLIIAKNKYNHRTFFADNWPNRAHNWLACIDHPSDKATVEFIVTAPLHYQVIANGEQLEETNLNNHQKLTRYKESVPLPMKVVVVGIADFAVQQAGKVNGIPIQSWVYPEDRFKGFQDYAIATTVLPFFIEQIGPYPYSKLANVQSKTIFGGMENAGAIFYFENSVTGNGKLDALVAHEIAHQWFGDMVTETHWSHVWLSEGFATYLTHLYLESTFGADTLKVRMEDDRKAIQQFTGKKTGPVVDSTITNYMDLLNANSYQKGGWVLHMLRGTVGDAVFRKGLKAFYSRYAGSNASTEDFRKVMEEISGADLKQFFRQWLYWPGHPELAISWTYDANRKSLLITVNQLQKQLFQFPLSVEIKMPDNKTINRMISVKDKETILAIPATSKPLSILADPNVQLLFEGTVKERK